MDVELDEYAEYAATQAADIVADRSVPEDGGAPVNDIHRGEGGGAGNKPRWTAEYAATCHDSAAALASRVCDDSSTMGTGVVGKKLAAMTTHVYILCYDEQCASMCVPKMWEGKTTVVDGSKTDQCFGVGEEKHVVRTTMSHAAAVAHAAVNKYPSMAMIEADSLFVDPDDGAFRGGGGGGGLGAGTSTDMDTEAAAVAPRGVVNANEPIADQDKDKDKSRDLRESTSPKVETWGSDDFKAIRHMIARTGRVAAAAAAAAVSGSSVHGARLGSSPPKEGRERQMESGPLIAASGDGHDAAADASLNSTDPGIGMTMIRLGYRVRNFEVGESSCRAPCGCVRNPGNNFWCTLCSTNCDLRGASAYILIADAYPLVLGPILRKGPDVRANNVIDHFVLQTIPQQVVVTPMLTVQDTSAPGTPAKNVYPPHAQLRDAHTYLKTCVTGIGRRAGGGGSIRMPGGGPLETPAGGTLGVLGGRRPASVVNTTVVAQAGL
jgi:hypothetical protein